MAQSNVLPFLKAKPEAKAQEICRWIILGGEEPKGIEDFTYLNNLRTLLNGGILPSTMERRIWEYAFGRPATVVRHEGEVRSLDHLSDYQLADKIETLIKVLKESVDA